MGDRVRVVATPGEQGEVDRAASSGRSPRRWWACTRTPSSGQTVVSVQVPFGQAAELAARSATGKVALVLDSRER